MRTKLILLLTVLALPVFGQSFIQSAAFRGAASLQARPGTNAAPSAFSITDSNFVIHVGNAGALNTTTTNYLASISAGTLLVLLASCEQDADGSGVYTNLQIGSSRTLTWTKRAAAHASGSCLTEIWTAPDAAGGELYVTNAWSSQTSAKMGCSSVLCVVAGAETSLGGNATNKTGVAINMSVQLATTRDNSMIFMAAGDWNAADVSSHTYRDTPVGDFGNDYQNGRYSALYWVKQTTTSGVYTEGVSAPTGGTATGFCAYEIRPP